ncbi:MAG: hypothetical protein ABL890_00955 [Candidatus Peribacteraceae bacterium]
MRVFTIIIGVIVTLSGCLTHPIPDSLESVEANCFNSYIIQENQLKPTYCKEKKDKRLLETNDFEILVPGNVFRVNNSETEIALSKYMNDDTSLDREFSIDIASHPKSGCSAWDLAITSPNEVSKQNTHFLWGKVTFWDHELPGGDYELPSTDCAPPKLWSKEWKERKSGQFAAYALCSEKDGKRVVVCIQQMTDNPEQAEEIFSTFRWTE